MSSASAPSLQSGRLISRLPARLRDRVVWLRLGLAAGGLLAAGIITGIIPFPDLGDALAGVSEALAAWTYLLVPALAFFETAAFLGLVVPGETAVLVGGVVAERGEVSLVAIIAVVWAASVAGDLTSFLLGRRLGKPFLLRHADRFRVKVEHIDRVERLFARHGGKTIVFGRFVGVLRAFTPFLAGTSGMTLRRFLPYSVSAALAWTTLFTVLGYVFSSSVSVAGGIVTKITLAVMVLGALGIGITRSRRARAQSGSSLTSPRLPASSSGGQAS